MKKIFFLALCATLFSVFFYSCTETLSGVGVSKTIKVAYMCTVPEIAPRYGCAGVQLPDPKVVDWHNVIDTVPAIALFSDSELNDAGYFYSGNTLSLPAIIWPAWLSDSWFWWPFLFLLVFGVMAWQLYRLANCCHNRRNQTLAPPTPPANPPAVPPVPKADNTIAQNALTLVGQKGGNMTYLPDGSFEINIDPPASKSDLVVPEQKAGENPDKQE